MEPISDQDSQTLPAPRFIQELGHFSAPLKPLFDLGIAKLTPATPVAHPTMTHFSSALAQELGLQNLFRDMDSAAQVFSGNVQCPSSFATRYGGYQFGQWAGQLGDGRALSLGLLPNSHGVLQEIQLKGAGVTAFSRRGDGRAVLRSSMREYLASEAMHHLGVPTSRALCCVETGDQVLRDMFYDGRPEREPGAITTRVAQTFLRPGHFEILAVDGDAHGDFGPLENLLRYTVERFFPQIDPNAETASVLLFDEVCRSTADLMVEWYRVGFVHGVMNTDNLSILGLTLDYGPFGFLDTHDPSWTPNTTDFRTRRYAFGQQPGVAAWNLARFAEALLPLGGEATRFADSLDGYRDQFRDGYRHMMGRKIGLNLENNSEDHAFLAELENILSLTEIDRTIFFRNLRGLRQETSLAFDGPWLRESFYSHHVEEIFWKRWKSWTDDYRARALRDPRNAIEVGADMDRNNPIFILRNYLLQEAYEARQWDGLWRALQTPYESNEHTLPYFRKRPEWARDKPGCSALSCSS